MAKAAVGKDMRHKPLPAGNPRGPVELALDKDHAVPGRLVWCKPLAGTARLVTIITHEDVVPLVKWGAFTPEEFNQIIAALRTRWFKVRVDARLYLFHESEVS